MTCWQKFCNWLSIDNIPESENSIIRDLKIIGIVDS